VVLAKEPSISDRSAHEREQLHLQILKAMVMRHEVAVSLLLSGPVSVAVSVRVPVLASLQKQLVQVSYWSVSRSVVAPVSIHMVLQGVVVDWLLLALRSSNLYSRLASQA